MKNCIHLKFCVGAFLWCFGCGINLDTPAQVVINCSAQEDCPKGLVCRDSIGRCVGEGTLDDFSEVVRDSVVVSDGDDIPGVFLSAGRSASVQFEVTAALVKADVRFVWGGSDIVRSLQPTHDIEGSTSLAYTYLVDGTEPEGLATLLMTVTGAGGIAATAELARIAEFDFTKPILALDALESPLVDIQLLAGPNAALSDVDALTVGSKARIAFSVDELLGSDPIVTAHAPNGDALENMNLVKLSGSGTAYVYELSIDDRDVVQGTYSVTALVTDRAGNTSDDAALTLGDVLIDTQAPEAPNAISPGKITFYRRPWGSDDSGGLESFTLAGSDGAAEANTQLWVFAGPELLNSQGAVSGLIDARSVRSDGSFGGDIDAAQPWALPIFDRPEIYVAAVDRAGNLSDNDANPSNGIQGTLVRNIVWTATLNHKVPGSNLDNPHSFETRQLFSDRLLQGASLPLSQVTRLAAADNLLTGVIGEGDWENVTPSIPHFRSDHAMTYDSARGRIVMTGGISMFVCDGNANNCSTWEGHGASWQLLSVGDPEGDGDLPRGTNYAMTYDSVRGVSVVYADGDIWEFDGASWRKPQLTDPEGDRAPAARSQAALAFDRRRRVSILFGGDTDDDGTWIYNGQSWRHMCLAPPCSLSVPSPRMGHSLVYDDARQVVVMYGGETDGTFMTISGSGMANAGASCAPIRHVRRPGPLHALPMAPPTIPSGNAW
ncbi:MAG: hypothetical protein R3C68_08445 [Myxococcota bacterium]